MKVTIPALNPKMGDTDVWLAPNLAAHLLEALLKIDILSDSFLKLPADSDGVKGIVLLIEKSGQGNREYPFDFPIWFESKGRANLGYYGDSAP